MAELDADAINPDPLNEPVKLPSFIFANDAVIIEAVMFVTNILEEVRLVILNWLTVPSGVSESIWYRSPKESTITIFTGTVEGYTGKSSNLTIGSLVLWLIEFETWSLLWGSWVPIPTPPSCAIVILWVSTDWPPVFLVSSLPVKNLISWPLSPLACIFILPWGLPPVVICKTSCSSLLPPASVSPPSPRSSPVAPPS